MIDILERINCGELSANEAEELLEGTIERYHDGELEITPQDELRLDKYEWTAIGFGMDLIALALWRKNGWPVSCENCSKEINYKDFGWKILKNQLVCIRCKL